MIAKKLPNKQGYYLELERDDLDAGRWRKRLIPFRDYLLRHEWLFDTQDRLYLLPEGFAYLQQEFAGRTDVRIIAQSLDKKRKREQRIQRVTRRKQLAQQQQCIANEPEYQAWVRMEADLKRAFPFHMTMVVGQYAKLIKCGKARRKQFGRIIRKEYVRTLPLQPLSPLVIYEKGVCVIINQHPCNFLATVYCKKPFWDFTPLVDTKGKPHSEPKKTIKLSELPLDASTLAQLKQFTSKLKQKSTHLPNQ